MQPRERVTIKRDCRAMLIPSGDPITLKQGQEVEISQALGGSYTVIVLGNMARIEGKDADVLGKAPSDNPDQAPAVATGPDLKAMVWDQLKTCFDPEIPVNIVDLGLIYNLEIDPMGDGRGHRVRVQMTLTAVGCGMGPVITEDARQKVLSVPGVADAVVELVWEPMWNQNMMSEAAKLQLGFL
ncbi:MAG: putative Fe-S cluster assembly protein SufT [Candidatus Neomarinimicrobiota bacterium]